MGIAAGGPKRGIMSETNVVPLIDVLLVLLVIFMIIPQRQTGLKAEIPQPASPAPRQPVEPDIVAIQVLDGGSLKINEQAVTWEALRGRLEEIFRSRTNHTAFIRGAAAVEFQVVAKVIDVMQAAGISSVGLLTPRLEQGHSAR
jgi:biopolymer transport protein TolR